MPRFSRPQTTPLELNLAPMVDVVMCLIIFFMLASKLVERENRPIELPKAASATEKEKRELGRRVVVNVEPDPDAPGRPTRYLVGDRVVVAADIQQRLELEYRRDPQVRCVVRGDRELPYRDIEAVLLAAARAGIEHVVFAATLDTREGLR